MSFDRPWLLLLVIPWLFLTYIGTKRLARHPLGPRGLRFRLLTILQVSLGLTVVLAAAGMRWVTLDSRLAVVIVTDRSRSTELVADLDQRLHTLITDAVRARRGEDLLGLVAFAREAETVLRPSRVPSDANLGLPVVTGGRDDTDLAAGILEALAEIPADTLGRIVLVSDGDQTRGDVHTAAMLAAAAGVQIDTVALSRPERRDVALTRLRVPERTERGRAIDLAGVVRSSRAGHGRITLVRDGTVLGSVRVSWGAGEDVVHLRDDGLSPGLHRYEARIAVDDGADDQVPGNEIAAGFVRVTGGARAVVISGSGGEGGGRAVETALRAAGLEVDRVGPESAPATSGQWARYDLVVLSNVRARELDPGAGSLLRENVRELGMGLWMVGSDRSFGPGGWGHSAVEEVLPVTMDLRRHRLAGRVALAIVIDRSGSMSAPTRDGRTKITLANEGAARAAAMLGPDDLVAISHVDTETRWTWPLQRAADTREIETAARTGTAGGGGIFTDVGLRDAYGVLSGAPAAIKHVILLADGDDAENSDGCEPLVADAFRRRITTSVVAIGRGQDEGHLERIARAGHGRYYLTEDARSLPAIFTEETVIAARNPIREESFVPRVRRGAEVLRGFDGATVPGVRGWVVTEARPRAEVLLEAGEGDPWLARWQVGAGRAAVLTSDLDGQWTQGFLQWPGATAMMGQMGVWLARAIGDQGARVTAVSDQRGRLRVLVDTVFTGDLANGTARELEARVLGPDGNTRRVTLQPESAGRYGAEIETPRSGSWIVTVTSPDGGVVGVTGVEVVASAEVTASTGNKALLAELSERTGGRVLTHLRGVFDVDRTPRERSRPIERALLFTALGLLVAGVGVRRLSVPSVSPLKKLWQKFFTRTDGHEETQSGTDGALARIRSVRSVRSVRSAATVKINDLSTEKVVTKTEEGLSERKSEGPRAEGEKREEKKNAESQEGQGGEGAGIDALAARRRSRMK